MSVFTQQPQRERERERERWERERRERERERGERERGERERGERRERRERERERGERERERERERRMCVFVCVCVWERDKQLRVHFAHLCAKVQLVCVCVCVTTLVYFPSYHSVTVMYRADQTKVCFTVTGRENGLLWVCMIRCGGAVITSAWLKIPFQNLSSAPEPSSLCRYMSFNALHLFPNMPWWKHANHHLEVQIIHFICQRVKALGCSVLYMNSQEQN